MRQRLQRLADRIAEEVGPFGHRVFVDSAPVLERALARNAGLGWIGKHTCLIDKDGGSFFFLGEIYVDLPLPIDAPASAHCGTCRAASTSARPRPSSRRTGSMRAAASPTSPSSTKARFPRNCARRSATASSAATTAS